jgi:tetratricopeptide (TPR) repeat protein
MKRVLLLTGLLISVLGALAVLTQTLVQAPARQRYGQSYVLIGEAQRLEAQGRVEEAREKVDEAYVLCPENPKVHRERGMQLLAQKEFGPGAEELRKAAQAQPGDAGAAWEAAFALSGVGRTEESIFWFDRVAHLEPGNGVAYAMLATSRLQQNRMKEALAAAQTGVHLSPRVPLTWFSLGLVYWQQRQYDPAREALGKAYARRPSDVRTLIALGAVCAEQKQMGLAINYLEKAVAVAPKSAQAWQALGNGYYAAGRSKEGARALERAGELTSTRPRLLPTRNSR